MIQQRDEIRQKIIKKYKIDPLKAQQIIEMPDHRLPPEEQLKMLSTGTLMK